ncbi:MAG: glutamate--cysteine ligase [Planctomycetaceae bacterium]|nr:glutamate--cysteine ligase [Planctomycetaceae bacterium]HAA67607.1 glutamate--cysteine ligase [Planctomycetaceae bacterium]|tara:strand:- start:6697 stop:7824 length:1128 start_codon:yes stop_codon:yes gene_type:complete
MGKLAFHSNDRPTIGIELELGIVDAQTMSLTSAIQPLIELLPEKRRIDFKPELMQCCIEVISGVCDTVADAETDLTEKLVLLEQAADQLNLGLWWGATHPFSSCHEQQVTPDPRYQDLVELLQEMARRLVTFGLHVHVGVDSGDKAVMICDRIMQYLPVLLSLSCSSPFWEDRNTGLASYRSKIMEGLPTAGLPTLMRNWSEYVWLINHLVDTGFINTIREIWWDVRPHHKFGTVELRVCDIPGRLRETLALAALIQCLVQTLSDEIDEGAYQHDCHPMMVRQNKWRACRFGTNAQLVNSFTYEVEPVPKVTEALIRRMAPQASELGCAEHLEYIQEMAEASDNASRQKALLAETGDVREMVRQLTLESRLSPRP